MESNCGSRSEFLHFCFLLEILCFVMSFHPFLHFAWDLKLIHTHSGIFPTLPTFLGVRDTTVGWMGVFLDEAKASNATQKLS